MGSINNFYTLIYYIMMYKTRILFGIIGAIGSIGVIGTIGIYSIFGTIKNIGYSICNKDTESDNLSELSYSEWIKLGVKV